MPRTRKVIPTASRSKGSGEETQEIDSPTGQKQTVHTYGWYLRQYATDAKAKGATLVICSPVPRNTWTDGKIKRGFDGYAQWAADAAKTSGALFVDLNTIAADRFDALGQQEAAKYFADNQHTTKAGAAQCRGGGRRIEATERLPAGRRFAVRRPGSDFRRRCRC